MWDMTVNVGLGTGDKTQQLMQLQTVAVLQQNLRAAGAPWVTDQNLYNMAKKTAELAGHPHDGVFFTDPSTIEPPEPQPSPEEMQFQAQAQLEQQKMEIEVQSKTADLQQKAEQTEAQFQIEKYKADLQAQTQIAIEQMKQRGTQEIEAMRVQSEAQFKIFEQNNRMNESENLKTEMGNGLGMLGEHLVNVSENLLRLEEAQLKQQEVMGQIISVITGDREIVRGDDDEPIGIKIIPSEMRQLPKGPITQNVRGNNVGN
jgi:multidrug efflux pump subunit AcrA (membrane-fusion protein)